MFACELKNFTRKRHKGIIKIICGIGVKINHVEFPLLELCPPHFRKCCFTFSPRRIYKDDEIFFNIAQKAGERLGEFLAIKKRVFKWILFSDYRLGWIDFHGFVLGYERLHFKNRQSKLATQIKF